MRRLVPPHIQQLARSGASHQASAGAALIVDAEGSTALSARLQPYGTEGAEALADILSAFFAPMVKRVTAHGGSVAEIAGDGILALFPGATDEAVRRALNVATEITADLHALSEFETPAGPASLTVRSVIGAGLLEWLVWSCDDPDAQQDASFVSFGGAVDEARRGEIITPGEVISVGPTAADHLAPAAATTPLSDGFLSIGAWEPTSLDPAEPSEASPAHSPLRFYPSSIVEADLRGEFRDVVAVFVDLTQSTDERHQSEMTHVLAGLSRHRGYLNHVIKPHADSDGIRVFALWGAPTSREHDVGYALRFLDGLRTAVGNENVRAGVTRSTAFTGFIGGQLQEQYTAIGPGINLASRICTAAGWGEIRVDASIVSRLNDPWACEDVGALEYRGFTNPIRTYQVVDIPPVLIADAAAGELVGRATELDQLEDLVAPLWSGRNAGVVVVSGEPGIGKSRLVLALEDRLSQRVPAPLWIHAQADEIRTQPLATLRDALAGYFGRPGRDESADRLDDYLGRLAADIPDRADELRRTRSALGDLLDLAPDVERTAALDPKARFENLVIAVESLIRALERTGPVILSIADGQWVDRGTADVLTRVSDDLKDRRVVVIIESRISATALEPDHRMEVGPLAENEIAELIMSSLGEAAPSDLVSTVVERSGGNPFFALQLVEYLRREGDLGRSRDASVPLDMRRVLVARLDDLPHGVRRLVQTASVLGRDVDLRILERMSDGGTDFVARVEQAVKAGVWDEVNDTTVTFSNSLIRDAAYGMLLHSDLRLLHAAAAAAVEDAAEPGAGRNAELAYHHDRAGHSSIASDHYLIAGTEAADRYDNHEALVLFDRALELLPVDDRTRRLRALRLKHDVHELEGDRSSQAVTIESMEELSVDDESAVIGVLTLRAGLHAALGEYREAEEVAERALTLAGPEATLERGALTFLKAQVARYRGRIEEAVALANTAREIFAQTGEALRVATVDDFAGGIAWETGDFEAAASLHRSAAEKFASAGKVTEEVRALNNLGTAIFSIGDYSTAREIHREGAERSRDVGYRMGEGDHLDNIGGTAWAVWDIDLAIEHYTAALEIREGMADLWGVAISKGNLGSAHRAMGNLQEGLALYREALEIDQRIGRRRGEAYDLHGIGLCQLGLGRNNLAAEALDRAAEIREEIEEPHLANESHVARAVAMMRRGDIAEATELVERALDEEGDHFFAAAMETTATRMRCVEVLATSSPDLAEAVKQRAREDVERRASRISDADHRRAYLERAETMFLAASEP